METLDGWEDGMPWRSGALGEFREILYIRKVSLAPDTSCSAMWLTAWRHGGTACWLCWAWVCLVCGLARLIDRLTCLSLPDFVSVIYEEQVVGILGIGGEVVHTRYGRNILEYCFQTKFGDGAGQGGNGSL